MSGAFLDGRVGLSLVVLGLLVATMCYSPSALAAGPIKPADAEKKLPGEVLRTAAFGIPDELYALPVQEFIILSTIQGRIVQTRLVLDFTTVGDFDAGFLGLGLQHGNAAMIFNGSDLGWSGTGHFTGEIESHDLNGEILYYGNPWATFLLYESVFPYQGGDLIGTFSNSAFIIRYVPDCPLDVNLDKFVTQADLDLVKAAQGTYAPELDVTGDGWVFKEDVVAVKNGVGTECPCPQCQ